MEHGLKAAESDLDRAQRLFAEGIIATERRDQTQVAVDQAAARTRLPAKEWSKPRLATPPPSIGEDG